MYKLLCVLNYVCARDFMEMWLANIAKILGRICFVPCGELVGLRRNLLKHRGTEPCQTKSITIPI